MNYLKIYYQIIDRARTRDIDVYSELHHIIPRSIYGSGLLDESYVAEVDHELNVVKLTAREHFIAHWLLHRAFPKNKSLSWAFWAMTMISPDNDRRYIPSSRAVEEARIAATSARRVAILQYDLNGKYLKEFKSLNSASHELGIIPTCIGRNINGFGKSAGGYQWRFKTKNYPLKIDPYITETNGLPIAQYDLNGNLLKTFDSLLEVERLMDFTEGSIRAAMNRGSKPKKANSFFVQYKKNEFIPKNISPYEVPLHGFSKPIVQLTPDGKYFINEFPNITLAAAHLNKNTGHISAACLGNRETAYGFKWIYKTDYKKKLPKIDPKQVKRKLHSISIAKYDLKGNFICLYNSASEAARKTRLDQPNISSAARGERNYAGKFQWAYIYDGENIPQKKAIKKPENISKVVLQLDSKTKEIIKEFESVGAAAREIGGSQPNISACINGRKKTAYGYKWKLKNHY